MKEQDLYCALTVYHEARGEDLEGQIAVAQVILNRSIQRELSVVQIVFQDRQFSCYNNGRQPAIRNYQALTSACEAVKEARQRRLEGNTLEGVNLYLNEELVKSIYGKLPYWTKRAKKVIKIGRHTFYKE